MFGSEGINGVRVSHPVLNPVTDPLYRTSSDPDWIHQTSGLLFEPSAPLTLTYSFPSRHPRTPLQTPLASGHWLHSIIPFTLPPYLPYLRLPACIRFLVPDSNSCPYSPDSDWTSYMDLLP